MKIAIEHHDDGSHTFRIHDGASRAIADMKGLHDAMSSLGGKYFVRHGDTDANDDVIFDGWAAYPLNEKGKQQAHQAAELLKHANVKRIVSSDIVRAKQTADIIGKELGVPVQVDPGLRPINTGKFTGLKKAENWKEFSKSIKDPDKAIPGGDSPNGFKKRIKETVAKYPSDTLFVTHNSGIIAATNTDYSPDEDMNEDALPPGGVMEVIKGKHQTKEI